MTFVSADQNEHKMIGLNRLISFMNDIFSVEKNFYEIILFHLFLKLPIYQDLFNKIY